MAADSLCLTGISIVSLIRIMRLWPAGELIVSQLKPGTVAMEACGGAHHLGCLLRDAGFEVRLMSPEYVRPYVKAQKNDDRDAEAIAEPATRPTMRFVELNAATEPEWLAGQRRRKGTIGRHQ
jgi:transposase